MNLRKLEMWLDYRDNNHAGHGPALVNVPCPDEGDGREECPTCDGDGWVYDPSDGGTMTCPECDGERKV